ncbi:MAG: hypothetical protein WEB63_03490 [Cucumibacter sp.]
MTEEKPKEGVRTIAPDEMVVAFSGPALRANRFFITINEGVARVAFAEQGPGVPPAFRSAVALDFTTAESLVNVLRTLLDRNVIKIEVPLATPTPTPDQPKDS